MLLPASQVFSRHRSSLLCRILRPTPKTRLFIRINQFKLIVVNIFVDFVSVSNLRHYYPFSYPRTLSLRNGNPWFYFKKLSTNCFWNSTFYLGSAKCSLHCILFWHIFGSTRTSEITTQLHQYDIQFCLIRLFRCSYSVLTRGTSLFRLMMSSLRLDNIYDRIFYILFRFWSNLDLISGE